MSVYVCVYVWEEYQRDNDAYVISVSVSVSF